MQPLDYALATAPRKSSRKVPFSFSSSSLIIVSLFLAVFFWARHDTSPLSVQTLRKQAAPSELAYFENDVLSNVTLVRRAGDYSCDKDKPCSNGACCGKSGYCGYGPTYCGDGCKANCDAVAECGQFAKDKGKECPLKTCCSEFGFCGTTKEFCGDKCQSNCVEHPKPPVGAASQKLLHNRVIGYYESWAARLDCHKVGPKDLALDALTHLNYAFAYIDPGTYNIVTMDGKTPESLFKDVTDVKSIKSDLKVWVSVGGWTFSDNHTTTQPLYGEIAADEGKRQKFADNTVRFMKQYGFDGLDIDWEYPGAPDRGGKKEDTDNFVKLTKTLRKTFDKSGSKFGLTFTAPSSYWYLRWFDLPGLVQNVDWINLMTYDLHGVWDATNPIGNIVQGHTNLTEIKLAAELFWRVGIAPGKVVMGFGFYGRAFTLADPKCSKPGCKFKGASNPGKCTATGGYLAYYEINDILNSVGDKRKRDKIEPVHDENDAVNYFTFDNDQWVSFDDDKTFKQKVDWANEAGLGGGLIWASDQDDDKFSAHKALLGRNVESTQDLQSVDKALSDPISVAEDLAGSNGQNCFGPTKDCVNLDDNAAMSQACGNGFTPVGWDDGGCGKKNHHYGKPICCPVDQAPKGCIWRGNGNGRGTKTDCNAQCFPGEINIKGIGSSWGGGFLNDGNTDKCGRGYKIFCCPSPDFNAVTQGCELTGCRQNCPTGKTKVIDKADDCNFGYKSYCCPNDPVQLTDCHWETGSSGTRDCVNPKCSETEVEIFRDPWGGSGDFNTCWYGRQTAACCTVKKAPPKPAFCIADLCAIKGYCPPEGDDVGGDDKKRAIDAPTSAIEVTHVLERRGGRETYIPRNVNIEIIAAAFPSIGRLYGTRFAARILRQFFRLIRGACTGPAVDEVPVPDGKTPPVTGYHTEHPIDVGDLHLALSSLTDKKKRQVMKPFVENAAAGTLPSGASAEIAPLPQSFWDLWSTSNTALGNAPPIGHPQGPQPDTPNGRAMDAFGTTSYPDPFMAVDAQINGAKASIFGLNQPTDPRTIDELAATAARNDDPNGSDIDNLLSPIRVAIAVFQYLQRPDAATRFNMVRNQVATQFGHIEQALGVQRLVEWWTLFTDDYFGLIESRAQDWATDVIHRAAAPFAQARANNHPLRIGDTVLQALQELLDEVQNMTLPPSNQGSIPYPHPPGGSGGGGSGGS